MHSRWIRTNLILTLRWSIVCLASSRLFVAAAEPPLVVVQDPAVGVLQRRDGHAEFYNLEEPHAPVVRNTLEGQPVTLEPGLSLSVPPGPLPMRLLEDEEGELHEIFLRARGAGRRIGVDRFIDLWHRRTSGKRSSWNAAHSIWEGYCGALMQFTQLKSGRIIAPFGEWIAGRSAGPPTGPNVVTAIYTDDLGETWHKSASQLVAPCMADFNGSNYGACEPAILEHENGAIQMLMRTQTGFLYASSSTDDGATWWPAKSSRFHSSTGPPGLVRLRDGRIVLLWNNCQMPPRVDGQGVYAGRDALHAAVSDDEGMTWRAFREIYRDPYRNETPPRSGDRGTAYPYGVCDQEGRLVVITGQGRGRRNLIQVDLEWLTRTTQEDDFSRGLADWHVFKPFGPASQFWRDRTTGPRLVDDTSAAGGKALHLRRPDGRDADGASWHFPLGWKGTLTLRVMPRSGFGGASVALQDRMFEPTDDSGYGLAMFQMSIDREGRVVKDLQLELDRWQTVKMSWDLAEKLCYVEANGQQAVLTQQQPTVNGVCYLQLRSLAEQTDQAGFLVDFVKVDINEPLAPAYVRE